MKTFNQFKQIAYKMAKPHKVYNNNRITNVGAGRAMVKRSSSSAGGNGGDGSGDGNGD
jgi:hypothetical protein